MSENTQDASIKRTFMFKGETYTMGRLVLAVIKDYAAAQKSASLKTLREAFPDSLLEEGSLHVVEDRRDIPPSREARYFLKPDEIIAMPEATAAVCNRWHRFNIYNFLPHARAMGYDIAELHDGVEVEQKDAPGQAAPKAAPAKPAPVKQAVPQSPPAQKEKAAPAKAPAKKAAATRAKPPKPKAEDEPIKAATAAPQWREPRDFLTWMQEGDASTVVSQWAFQSTENVLSSLESSPLPRPQLNGLARYIYAAANTLASFERQFYHMWLSKGASPQPQAPGAGEKDYIDFLQCREDAKLDNRAQNAALKKLGAFTQAAGAEPLPRGILNIALNLCMEVCLSVVTAIFNVYHVWLGEQTDFCLKYPPYKAYEAFLAERGAQKQLRDLLPQNLAQVVATGQLDFANQAQLDAITSMASIVTETYMDSFAKDYHKWLAGGTAAKKAPNAQAAGTAAAKEAPAANAAAAEPTLEDLFEMGQAAEADERYDKALEYYALAAGGGHVEANVALGGLYEYGQGTPQDVNTAAALYGKAANDGSVDGMKSYGTLLLQHGHAEKALDWLKKAAELGAVDAMFNAGTANLMLGHNQAAIQYFTMAAEQGDEDAIETLERIGKGPDAGFHLTDADGDAVSFVALDADGNVVGGSIADDAQHEKLQALAAAQRAVQGMTPEQLETAAQGGNDYAMFQLGQMYWNGDGVAQNREKALEWLAAAEEHGSGNASSFLKSLVEKGELMLANSDDNSGGGSYAVMDDKGKVLEVNVPPGTVPATITILKGIAPQYANGRRDLEKGHQCLETNDISGAEKHWLKAAGKGNLAAMCNLGNLYQHYYSPPPMDHVWYWYQQAAGGGVREAATYLQRMSGQ